LIEWIISPGRKKCVAAAHRFLSDDGILWRWGSEEMDNQRAMLWVTLVAVLANVRMSASIAQPPVSQCISDLQAKYGASPAFKITCTSPADCEFEPSQQQMNASAIALIDVMARTVIACWQSAGLKTVISVSSPPSLHLFVQRYQASDQKPFEVCSIAELRPFGEDKLTTSFRAACRQQ
jgi:hypothetical protein